MWLGRLPLGPEYLAPFAGVAGVAGRYDVLLHRHASELDRQDVIGD
jgi:hypothetical protein